MLKQLSVWLPNKPGMLKKFLDVLIDHNIELRAITVAENEEYGILLILVDKPDECIKVLDELDYPVSETMVLAVKLKSENNAISLQEISKIIGENNINIDYLYSTLVKDESLIILKVDNNEKAIDVLKEDGFILEDREAI
ncbi:MAG: acetolactate synthase [Promethearchaeota archaeon]